MADTEEVAELGAEERIAETAVELEGVEKPVGSEDVEGTEEPAEVGTAVALAKAVIVVRGFAKVVVNYGVADMAAAEEGLLGMGAVAA